MILEAGCTPQGEKTPTGPAMSQSGPLGPFFAQAPCCVVSPANPTPGPMIAPFPRSSRHRPGLRSAIAGLMIFGCALALRRAGGIARRFPPSGRAAQPRATRGHARLPAVKGVEVPEKSGVGNSATRTPSSRTPTATRSRSWNICRTARAWKSWSPAPSTESRCRPRRPRRPRRISTVTKALAAQSLRTQRQSRLFEARRTRRPAGILSDCMNSGRLSRR